MNKIDLLSVDRLSGEATDALPTNALLLLGFFLQGSSSSDINKDFTWRDAPDLSFE